MVVDGVEIATFATFSGGFYQLNSLIVQMAHTKI